jgi:hypothetical protein
VESGRRFVHDSSLEEGGFEPLVPPQNQHNRGTGPMSPTASIRVGLVIPLANSISISVASGTSGSNPLSSSGESRANLRRVPSWSMRRAAPAPTASPRHRDGQVFFASLAGNYLGRIDLETGITTDHHQQNTSFSEGPTTRRGCRSRRVARLAAAQAAQFLADARPDGGWHGTAISRVVQARPPLRFSRDSLLERTGFEPSVPRDTTKGLRGAYVAEFHSRTRKRLEGTDCARAAAHAILWRPQRIGARSPFGEDRAWRRSMRLRFGHLSRKRLEMTS